MNLNVSGKNPSMDGIFAGISKGLRWFDKECNPSIGVAYSYCVGGCGIVGELSSDNKENKIFFEQVFKDLRAMNIHEFEFSTEDNRLREQMLDLFHDKTMHCEMEYSYRLAERIEEKAVGRNKNITYIVADKKFIKDVDSKQFQNEKMFTERLDNSWKSREDFLSHVSPLWQ